MSYNYFYNWAITVAVDITAACILMQYWYPHVPAGVWAIAFLVLLSALNFYHVKVYGETQYWFSFIKIAAVIIFIVVGTLMIFGLLGNHPVGFKNWTMPGAPFHGGWYAIIAVFLVVGFSFQGTETVGVAAGEVEDPRKNVPKAIRTIFWRILLFYVLAIVVMAFLIPYNDSSLVNPNNTNVEMSPFTLIFSQAGLKIAGSLVNLIMVTAVLSACNSSMYTATRTLWFMAKEGQVPRVLSVTSQSGVPRRALCVTILFGMLSLLLWFYSPGMIFQWLVNISALAGFVAWFGIAWSHYRFRKQFVADGHKLEELPYRAKFYPFGPIFAAILCVLVIVGQFTTFTWGWMNFFSMYVGIIAFLVIWVAHRLWYRRRLPL